VTLESADEELVERRRPLRPNSAEDRRELGEELSQKGPDASPDFGPANILRSRQIKTKAEDLDLFVHELLLPSLGIEQKPGPVLLTSVTPDGTRTGNPRPYGSAEPDTCQPGEPPNGDRAVSREVR
jgi:hypothetical protein